jgi:lipopolysaccharide assembly protein A
MRTIKLILLALILIAIVLLALANREIVTVQLLPEPLDQVVAASVDVPLFVVGLVSILVGMVLGYILEWLREYKYRRRAAQKSREAEQLSRELDRVKKSGKPEDDVLALIN